MSIVKAKKFRLGKLKGTTKASEGLHDSTLALWVPSITLQQPTMEMSESIY